MRTPIMRTPRRIHQKKLKSALGVEWVKKLLSSSGPSTITDGRVQKELLMASN
jgi:hypothetical protein